MLIAKVCQWVVVHFVLRGHTHISDTAFFMVYISVRQRHMSDRVGTALMHNDRTPGEGVLWHGYLVQLIRHDSRSDL